jgi:tetratricopeptide (TPR) repeat protein
VSLGVALFVIALLPVLGLVPFDFQQYSNVADHYVYLAMLGPALGLALGHRALPRAARHVVIPLGLATLGALAFVQTSRWRDDATLYAYTLSVNPRSVMARNNTGQALEERGLLEEALVQYRQALEVAPDFQDALNNVGNVLFKLGRYDDAIRHYTDVFRRADGHTETIARMHNNLGAAYLKTGRYDEAVAEFRRASAIDPDYLDPCYNLGIVLMAFGRRAEAAEAFRRGLAIDPGHAALRAQLAAAETAPP